MSNNHKYNKPVIWQLRLNIVIGLILLISVSSHGMMPAEGTGEVERAFSLLEQVREANNFITSLDSLYTIDFPVGIKGNDRKDDENYAIIIPEMYIMDGISYITAYMAFTIPGTTKKVAFKGSTIPLSVAGGIQGIGVLELVNDFDIPFGGGTTIVLKGNGTTNVKWDCNGFLEMEVSAEVLFDPDLFLPENDDGSVSGEQLRTSFHTVVNDWNNILIGVSLDPFQIKGLDGFGFKVTNAVLDISDYRNPMGIIFPSRYATDFLIEDTPNTWQGIYIQQAEIRFPPWFRQKQQSEEGKRLTIDARNMFIDEMGFTGEIGASGIMSIDEGDMGGWDFSLENFSLLIHMNTLTAGGFSGKIKVPELGKNTVFDYRAVIGLDRSYGFTVAINETLNMEMWAAEMTVERNSYIDISLVDNQFLPSMVLNGSLSINSPVDNNRSENRLELYDLRFQGMKIQTVEPYFEIDYLSFGSGQGRFSLFPVSMTNIDFRNNANRRGLDIGLTINFTGEEDGAFGGNGFFTVWGKKNGSEWEFDGVEVGVISVGIDKGEAFSLYGEVGFLKGDEVYGNGFKGIVDASIAGCGLKSTALFGNVDGYRYFYADALMSGSVGIPLGPLAIYGFGGGAYYNMRQTFPENTTESIIGQSVSGILYEPEQGTGMGIKASVKLGLLSNADLFNGDVEMGVDFNKSGGLEKIVFKGNAYFATKDFSCETIDILQNARNIMTLTGGGTKIPKETDKSALMGDITLEFDFPARSFHSSFNVYANIGGGVVTGSGPNGLAGYGAMHFSPEEWYIMLGSPSNPNGLRIINIAELNSYFMAGNDIPDMPDPSSRVVESLIQHGTDYSAVRNYSELAGGSGLVFGSSFKFDTGNRTFLIFYGEFGCDIGFDMMMKNYRGTTCLGSSTLGINGWYAQGQAYSWIKAEVGIGISLPFYSGKYQIFDMELATLMRAKGPNPLWLKGDVGGHYNLLNGMVRGKCNFEFEIGEQCVPITGSDLGKMSVIAGIKPDNNEENVGVFTAPQVIFNMAVDTEIEIMDIDGSNRLYRARIDELTVENVDGAKITGNISWNDSKDVALFNPNDILPGETDIRVGATITFEEKRNGVWQPVTDDGAELKESMEAVFTTGKKPDHVPQENVQYSYPGYRAFNHYSGGEGYIRMRLGQPELFSPGDGWDQTAQLTDMVTDETRNLEYRYDNNLSTIFFVLPGDLADDRIYRFEIIDNPTEQSIEVDDNIRNGAEIREVGDEEYSTEVEITTRYAEGTKDIMEPKVIYSMAFRKSPFPSLREKLGSAGQSDVFKLYNSYLTMRLDDMVFDNYELGNDVNRLVSVSPHLGSTLWYSSNLEPLIFMTENEMASIGAKGFDPGSSTVILKSVPVRDFLDEAEIESGSVLPVSGQTIINNYLIKESLIYYNDTRVKIANKYIDNPQSVGGNLLRILNSSFPLPARGNYPVRLDYILPGRKEPYSSTIINMEW